jgi:trk system potassium uptake protein TrkA
MLAKQLGAGKVMSLVNRYAYVDLIEKQATIDVAISPQQVTIGALLTHVRRGDVVAVHSLRRGAAEAIEAVAHGDARTSRVVGRQIEQISLPEGATIGAVVRGEQVMMAHHDTLIETDDHLIIFMQDRRKTPEVEKLFQVSVTFM